MARKRWLVEEKRRIVELTLVPGASVALLATSGVGGSFTYTYDNARNRISMADGNGTYDGPGNLISVTDQANNQVQYKYDAANQLINVVQVNSPNTNANTTIYGYL
jgi:YD repeat-containing protein